MSEEKVFQHRHKDIIQMDSDDHTENLFGILRNVFYA